MMYGRDDLLPMWVADMDFAVSDEIREALTERIKHPVFGYNLRLDNFYEALQHWQKKRFGWETKREWVIATPGIVPAIAMCIQSLTESGDKVLIQTPVYTPFHATVTDHGRQLLCSALLNDKGIYSIDWDDFERKLAESKLFILCNPHNPVGRVWSKEELTQMGELCRKHKVVVFSDEIHEDLVYPGFHHIPFASLQDFAQFSITGISPAKSFNIAGLATAVALVPDSRLRDKLNAINNRMALYMGNSFGIAAFIAAYTKSESWLNELLAYLKANRDYIRDFIAENLPEVILSPIEGTYLAWLDFRAWQMDDSSLQDLMVNKARLALEPGIKYGKDGSGFMRLNFGCPRSVLEEAMQRIKDLHK
jgi:cystathionine beta-lyase